MSDKRFEQALPPASLGEAPGRERLKGRRILVVGGGQRIFDEATDPAGNGRAMCQLFAREGASVAVADIDLDSAQATVDLIKGEDGTAITIQANIALEDDIARMIDEAHDQLGGLDGMVLNVGIGVGQLRLEGTSVEDWDATLAVNLRGPMLCCKAALPKMSDSASIIFISSIAALRAGSQLVGYDSSKAALDGLMRHVAFEGRRRGIRANLIYPGLIDTPLGRLATAGRPSRGKSPIPFGRQATAWEVANAALFFVSEDSIYLTAQTLAVDGGITGF